MPSQTTAWVVLGIFVPLYVAGYDVWAHYTQHVTMTGQMREWLTSTVAGPFFAGAWAAIFVGLMYHFFQHLTKQR